MKLTTLLLILGALRLFVDAKIAEEELASEGGFLPPGFTDSEGFFELEFLEGEAMRDRLDLALVVLVALAVV